MARALALLTLAAVLHTAGLPTRCIAQPNANDPRPPAVAWLTDYARAMQLAKDRARMLLVFFYDPDDSEQSDRFEAESLGDPAVRARLGDYVCARLPLDAKAVVKGRELTLLEDESFAEMLGRPGIAVIDLVDPDAEDYGYIVSMFPLTEQLWYDAERMLAILDLPTGSLTQRTLIYAVRTHPDAPASADGRIDPRLLEEARSHSQYQADIHRQGHHRWSARFVRIGTLLPGDLTPTEVCAESWPGEHLVEAAIECVRCWRLSSGHWSAVSAAQPVYGYDMKCGSNGVWYATGIFGSE